MKKTILFTLFVFLAYFLFMLTQEDRNVESYPIPHGRETFYNPY